MDDFRGLPQPFLPLTSTLSLMRPEGFLGRFSSSSSWLSLLPYGPGRSVTVSQDSILALSLTMACLQCTMLVLFQRAIIMIPYFPPGSRTASIDPKDPYLGGLRAEKVSLPATKSTPRLDGLFVARNEDSEPDGLVYYLQGESGIKRPRRPLTSLPAQATQAACPPDCPSSAVSYIPVLRARILPTSPSLPCRLATIGPRPAHFPFPSTSLPRLPANSTKEGSSRTTLKGCGTSTAGGLASRSGVSATLSAVPPPFSFSPTSRLPPRPPTTCLQYAA